MPLSQSWINLVGLVLDLAGFLLLLREWWLGFFGERQQLEMALALERQQRLRAFAATSASEAQRRHLETSGRMLDDLATGRAREVSWTASGARRRMFITATVLILAGYALQIAAAVPL